MRLIEKYMHLQSLGRDNLDIHIHEFNQNTPLIFKELEEGDFTHKFSYIIFFTKEEITSRRKFYLSDILRESSSFKLTKSKDLFMIEQNKFQKLRTSQPLLVEEFTSKLYTFSSSDILDSVIISPESHPNVKCLFFVVTEEFYKSVRGGDFSKFRENSFNDEIRTVDR